MFWSKIWLFLLTLAAMVALCIALLMPRPAERQVQGAEEERLGRARWGVEMLLRDNARVWVDLASGFARAPAPAGQPRLKLDEVLDAASRDRSISGAAHATARDTLQYILAQVSGAQKPEFVVALDRWGRVVAGVGDELFEKGDELGGYFLVQDALRGYLRDDLWYENGKLYRVAAAPVIERSRSEYVGALLLGDEADLTLAKDLEDRVGAHVAFFAGGETVAVSKADHAVTKDILAAYDANMGGDDESEDAMSESFDVQSGNTTYQVALRALPGEVAARDGFFAVFAPEPGAVGVMGTLRGLTRDDVGLATFPWIWVALAFLVVLALGVLLLIAEGDKPLRRLVLSSVKLGRGELDRLPENQKGKYGSVARSVNMALERFERDARMAPKSQDLGALLGPTAADTPPPPVPPPGAGFSPRPAGGGFQFPGDVPAPAASTPPPRPASPAPPPRPPDPAPAGLPVASTERGLGLDDEAGALEFSSNSHTGADDPFAPPPPGAASAHPSRARRKTASLALQPEVSEEELLANTADLSQVTSGPPDTRASSLDSDFGGETVIGAPSDQLLRASASDAEGSSPEAAGFEKVYSEFIQLKERCGESVEGLTLAKFSEKLRKNRDQLVGKYNCKAVKFQVYIKDGKAALKATPIRS